MISPLEYLAQESPNSPSPPTARTRFREEMGHEVEFLVATMLGLSILGSSYHWAVTASLLGLGVAVYVPNFYRLWTRRYQSSDQTIDTITQQ